MHGKKIYINKSMYSIQGLKTVSNSLPNGLKTILKKGGHNYSTIIYNWSNLVGKKIASVCYPKSVKTDKDLKNGMLVLNVFHGDQLFIEYSIFIPNSSESVFFTTSVTKRKQGFFRAQFLVLVASSNNSSDNNIIIFLYGCY